MDAAQAWFSSKGCVCELINLVGVLPEQVIQEYNTHGKLDAYVLVIKKGLEVLLGEDIQASSKESSVLAADETVSRVYGDGMAAEDASSICASSHASSAINDNIENLLDKCRNGNTVTHPRSQLAVGRRVWLSDLFYEEQQQLPKDTHAKMYGRVVQKHARHNLCFNNSAQEPDYSSGKGRIIAYTSVPLLAAVMRTLAALPVIGAKCGDLAAEGNYYYDLNKYEFDCSLLYVFTVVFGILH